MFSVSNECLSFAHNFMACNYCLCAHGKYRQLSFVDSDDILDVIK
jgi:hypothetical protein